MSKSIVITFNKIPEGMTDHEIKFAVNDALAEFWWNRDPVWQYVSKRYAGMSKEWVARKAADVERRVALMKENVELGDVITTVAGYDNDGEWREDA